MSHQPVLLNEVISYLQVKKGGFYVDATFGLGGHSKVILAMGGKVLGIEWDEDLYQKARIKYQGFLEKNLFLANKNFAQIETVAKEKNFYPVDGVLFDLGISMEQIENSGRGFSFKKLDEPLDLRINTKIKMNAAYYLNYCSKEELYQIFAKNTEVANFKSLVDEIVRRRNFKPIEKVGDLVSIIDDKIKQKSEKIYRQIWQGLRILVNYELENLKKGLEGAKKILKQDGRLLVITFHSLEDRVVKKFAFENDLNFLTKKPIISLSKKTFERSAKLRVFTLK